MISLTAASPSVDLKLFLASPVELSGRLLDAGTDAPLPGVRVNCLQDSYIRGRRVAMPEGSGMTDTDGRFRCQNLPPGEYFVWVRSQADLADTYLPGGPERDNAIATGLASGASLSLGNLSVRKIRKYNVRIKVDCAAGVEVFVEARTPQSSLDGNKIACGSEKLVSGWTPGEWKLDAYTLAGPPESHLRASLSIVVKDRDLDVSLTPVPGITAQGRVLGAEGVRLPALEGQEVRRFSETLVNVLSEVIEGTLDAKGAFRFSNLASSPYRIWLPWLPATHYVKEMRYNGVAQPWPMLTPNPHAASHTLEIELDDKPATLSGTVMDGRRPAPQARVWLIPAGGGHAEAQTKDGDEKGAFRFAGLAPGEYRILASEPLAGQRLHAPGGLERALANARTLTLGPRAAQTVTLERQP